MIRAALVAAALSPLHVYSSMPAHGPARAESADIVRAEQLALEEAGNPVELISRDDSTKAAGTWEPRRTSANARVAAQDQHTIAYLGEFNSGASAISIPILSEAGILQVSPVNAYVGLTRREGAERGEPGVYYPAGRRTFGRVGPADNLQADATVSLLASLGIKRVLLLDDAEIYGLGMAKMVRRRALARGIAVVGPYHVEGAGGARRLVKRAHANAMVFGGISANHATRIFAAAHRAAPRMTLVGGTGVAEPGFARRLGRGAARRTLITNAPLAAAAYPPAGQAFFAAFGARYGHAPAPFAIFGYEAMKVVLAAIESGGGDRRATIDAFFGTRERDSVLGRYSIDANGDTTLSTYGVYRVEKRRLVFDRVVDSST
jgi:branched-chain amino acid transport system substrate-binding protein